MTAAMRKQVGRSIMQGHLYFLGIGGTLMGSLALLAKELGFQVSGSDEKIYPPMSDLLAAADITVFEGFTSDQLDPRTRPSHCRQCKSTARQ